VILLDTHVATWFAMDDEALGKQSRMMADTALAEDRLAISAISFWEIALLVAKGRLALRRSAAELRNQLLQAGVIELPLTGDIALLAVNLQHLHGDPADRFIMATAVAHDATLITADNTLLRWRHKVRRQNAVK
jgi:PIN domain nuclease of toxin-antitoxin system